MIAIFTIVSALKNELGTFFSTEAHKDNDIIRYINSTARDIVNSRNFDFNKYETSVTVVSGTDQYSIPYQIETFLILDAEGNEIDILNFEEYFSRQDKTGCIGISGDKMYCTTPGVYTIYYRGYIPTITALTGNLDIPEHFYDAILVGATYYGFMAIRSYQTAGEKKSIFDAMIKPIAKRSSNPQPMKIKRLNNSKNNSKVW